MKNMSGSLATGLKFEPVHEYETEVLISARQHLVTSLYKLSH
jgi:hypothetical protein